MAGPFIFHRMKSFPFVLSLTFAITGGSHAETVLGKAGAIEVKTSDVKEALAGLEAGGEASLSKDPAAISQYVRALLIQRLVLQQAAEDKIDQDPAVIAKLVRARETALSEAYLDLHSRPPSDFPSDEEIEAAYETAKPSLLLPKAYRLAQIFTKEESKATDLKKRLSAKDADFSAIARSESEETASAANGGEIGWLTEAQLQEEIRAKLPTLQAGQTSGPIRLQDGWHFIRLIEVREPATATLDQVRPQLVARLKLEQARQLRQEHVARLLKDHPVAINEIELQKLLSTQP